MFGSLGSLKLPPGGQAVAAYDPLEALGASLLAWWDAEHTDLLTIGGGGAVSAWEDKVGGLTPVQATGSSQPIYDDTAVNGRPALSFDGIDDFLLLGTPTGLPTGANPCEIWALIDQTNTPADTTSRRLVSYGGLNSRTSRRINRQVISSENRFRCAAGTTQGPSVFVDAVGDFSGISVVRGIITGADIYAELNGSLAGPVAFVPTTADLGITIGAFEGGVSTYLQGLIASILFTNLLTTPQADELRAYLMQRGGVST